MEKVITWFKKYFSAMLLVVITLLVGWAFGVLWGASCTWWEHSLLVLGAAIGEVLALVLVCCNLERRYRKESADTSLFDAEEWRANVAYVLCCIGLAIVMCVISASVLWIILSIVLMVMILLFGLMAFFCVREVVYEPYSI